MGRANPRRHRDRTASAIVVFVLVALVNGCAVKLAPNYDRILVDGLAKANEDAMILFASASSSAPGTFDKRENAYNGLIGKFEALELAIPGGYGPRVAESAIGLITNMSSSAPYEELRLKAK